MDLGLVPKPPPPWWAYPLWLVAGGLWGLGFLSILTIGVYVMFAALIVTVVALLLLHGPNRTTFLALSGLGLAPLYLALLNWGGPTTCPASGSGSAGDAGLSCVEKGSPYPWLVVGLLLVVVGILVAWLIARRYKQLAAKYAAAGTVPSDRSAPN